MRDIFFILVILFIGNFLWGQDPIPPIEESGGSLTPRDKKNINKAINQANQNKDNIVAAKLIFNYEDSTIVGIRYIDYDLENGWVAEEGRAGWNDDDKTLNIGLDAGSVLQDGQEIHVRCTNKTGSLIADMKIVYVIGAQGQRPIIGLANNKYVYKSASVLGVSTQDIANNSTGYVTTQGLVRDVNTAAWPDSTVLWLDSIDGGFTDVRPGAGLYGVTGFVVQYSHATEGILLVNFARIPTLAGLSDVDARGNQVHWDVLYWDEDSLVWELSGGKLNLPSISTYADNAAALVGGLVVGDVYQTATGALRIVY